MSLQKMPILYFMSEQIENMMPTNGLYHIKINNGEKWNNMGCRFDHDMNDWKVLVAVGTTCMGRTKKHVY